MNTKKRNVLKVGLCMLCALVGQGCGSSRGIKHSNDGGAGADGSALPVAVDSGPGADVGGNSVPVDAGGCRGLAMPDADCGFGTPTYICVERHGGWVWDHTCPRPPQDAARPVDSVAMPPADCQAAVDRLMGEMNRSLGACTAVVRLDYSSLRILSHAFVCGTYARVDEAFARRAADTVIYPPISIKAGTGTLLSGSNATGPWVFYSTPGDFGGVTVVSGLTGLPTFAGTIVWGGGGDVLLPETWSTSDLGKGCNTTQPWDTRTFNLTGGLVTDLNMREAAGIVLSTALSTAFQRWGGILGTTVLLYPRGAGGFDPSTAEFIVLLDGGWLE
jgi:hypothetical protein